MSPSLWPSVSCSASARRRVRSISASSTVSIRLTSVPGASCATAPTRQALGQLTCPSSGCNCPRMTLNKVDLPAPLRPTSPMRRPAGRLAVAPDRISRPAIRTTILSIASMGGLITCQGSPARPVRAAVPRRWFQDASLLFAGRHRYKARDFSLFGVLMAVERTLSIIKPDATRRNLTGKIIAKFEEAGLSVVASRRIRLSTAQAEAFYGVHSERPFFRSLVDFMTSGPVVVQVLEGENPIAKNGDGWGPPNPANAAPGTIRKEFAESIEANSVHGSDAAETAANEIRFFFSDLDIHS